MSPLEYFQGLPPDLQVALNTRFDRIEQFLGERALAQPYTTTGGVIVPLSESADVAQPQNVQTKVSSGLIEISWDAVDIPDLKIYQLQISSFADFLDAPSLLETTEPRFSFNPGGARGVTFYVRVRAVTGDNIAGSFSAVINATNGLIVTEDLAAGAAHQLASFRQVAFGIVQADPNPSSATYGSAVLAGVKDGSRILPFASVIFDYATKINTPGSDDLLVTIDFIRDSVVTIDSFEINIPSDVGDATPPPPYSFARGTANGLGLPHVVAAGDHAYDIKITVQGTVSGDTITIQPIDLRMEIVELRRVA